jgi:hypothetical protein
VTDVNDAPVATVHFKDAAEPEHTLLFSVHASDQRGGRL